MLSLLAQNTTDNALGIALSDGGLQKIPVHLVICRTVVLCIRPKKT